MICTIMTGLLLALQLAIPGHPAFAAANGVFFGLCLGMNIAETLRGRS